MRQRIYDIPTIGSDRINREMLLYFYFAASLQILIKLYISGIAGDLNLGSKYLLILSPKT